MAVKVQRPNVARDLHVDAAILRQVAALFQRILAGPSDLVAIADQLVRGFQRTLFLPPRYGTCRALSFEGDGTGLW